MEELKDFIEKSKAQGTTQFYSTTDFGRRRYFDPRKVRKDTIERQSCNARIQGTAADIYKVAMVRLLHQIRKNGWLGKILISAFVHDECFLEVHKSLDPIVVLKVLRSCMMLDKEGWCPLFIGCGYGHNWYEAKKSEIPIQVQEILINRYGDSGLDWWSGDTDRLCNFVADTIHDYSRDRVISYLKEPDNHGKVLNPAVNSLAHTVVQAIRKGVHIDGCVTSDIEEKEDVIDNLMEFGKAFGCVDLVEKAEVARPVHTAVKEEDYDDEEEDDVVCTLQDTLKLYMNSIGCYYKRSHDDEEPDRVYFHYSEDKPAFMKYINGFLKRHEGSIPVMAVKDDMSVYETGMLFDKNAFPELIKVFAVGKSTF